MAGLFRLLTMLLVVAATFGPAAALADDWRVVKARGQVLQLVDGAWAPLRRGDIVPDDRVLRTMTTGRAELRRGAETISLQGGTQLQIHDADGRRYTTVQHYFGTVGINADALDVEHFAVQTPYLAAVVKGTRFTVTTGPSGSVVAVQRGAVGVTSRTTRERTTLAAGEAAAAGKSGALTIGDSDALEAAVAREMRGNNGLHLGQQKNGNNGNGNDKGNAGGNSGGNGNGSGNAGGNGNGNAGGNGNGGKGNGRNK